MRYGNKAWIGLGVYLAVVEVAAPQGETLSEAMDDWLIKHPAKALCHLAVLVTAAHLLNLIPQRYDLIHQLFSVRLHLQRIGINSGA
jgi:hypothetical protein